MTRLVLILLVILVAGTVGCANPFRRPTDVPSCYFPKPNKDVEPIFRAK